MALKFKLGRTGSDYFSGTANPVFRDGRYGEEKDQQNEGDSLFHGSLLLVAINNKIFELNDVINLKRTVLLTVDLMTTPVFWRLLKYQNLMS